MNKNASVNLRYDPLHRLTNLVDAVGTSGFTYFPGGLLASEDGPWLSDTVTNGYVRGLRYALGLQQPAGWWTNGFVYDLARRLTNVTSPAGTFGYTFGGPSGFAGSLIQKFSLPGGGSITNDFDALARLRATVLLTPSSSILDAASCALNAGHQRTWFTNGSGTAVGYSYDNIGQLQVADSANDWEDRGYTYDASWNLRYRTNNGALQSFGVDNENQMTAGPDGACSYDANGNLTSAKNGDQTFGYDAENQLVEVVNLSSGVPSTRTALTYDGMNRLRIRREYAWVAEEDPDPWDPYGPALAQALTTTSSSSGGGGYWELRAETRYLYDGWRVIQERDGNNTPQVSYTRGTDLSGSLEGAGGIGGLLARSPYDANSQLLTPSFYFCDGNGNILRLVNSTGTSQASYRYDPYGNLLGSSGALAAANVYRFSSKEFMATAGLYYYGYRFYSPTWQRWVRRDPLGELGFELHVRGFSLDRPSTSDAGYGLLPDLNTYAHTLNDPLNAVDPDGRVLFDRFCNAYYVPPAYWDGVISYNDAVKRLTDKYGDEWPIKIVEYMDRWERDLVRGFPRFASAIVRAVPGTSITGPVVRPKRL